MTFEEEVQFYLDNFDKESLAKLYVIALLRGTWPTFINPIPISPIYGHGPIT